MPRDVSSSSEDDADVPVAQAENDLKTTRYRCPSGFVGSSQACNRTLMRSLKNRENDLWLIKAPASFSPECLSGVTVPLSGLQNLKVPVEGGEKTGSGQQVYSVLASARGAADLRLLTGDQESPAGMLFGPAFSGLLNVFERHGDGGPNQAPHVIPAAPAPSIPPGLKQRFKPLMGAAASESSSPALCHPAGKRVIAESWQEEEGRKKKKKKKKEKRIKFERDGEEMVTVKVEPGEGSWDEVMTELQEGGVSGEKRKKKKKKDRERGGVEENMEPSVAVKVEAVKCEQTDRVCGEGRRRKAKHE
ncbi:DNA-directed RNA polymerase I subunit RPA34 [Brachionichthys hirsutus]|uniref:DNA-directed RNA polymerase I subunit RPA34 n=1 Tax=Brachionichthys hirsutus TaxID=412623 RepID=UPI0036054059